MSKDKHKKRDRAYAFLRTLHWTRVWGGGHEPHMPFEKDGTQLFSGPPTATMHDCVRRGWARIRRTGLGEKHRSRRARHNEISAWVD